MKHLLTKIAFSFLCVLLGNLTNNLEAQQEPTILGDNLSGSVAFSAKILSIEKLGESATFGMSHLSHQVVKTKDESTVLWAINCELTIKQTKSSKPSESSPNTAVFYPTWFAISANEMPPYSLGKGIKCEVIGGSTESESYIGNAMFSSKDTLDWKGKIIFAAPKDAKLFFVTLLGISFTPIEIK